MAQRDQRALSMPARAKARLACQKKRCKRPSTQQRAEDQVDSGEDAEEPEVRKEQWVEPKWAEARIDFFARLAWLTDYTRRRTCWRLS